MHIRPVTIGDAAVIAETTREGFESFFEWAPASYDAPAAAIEEERISEGLARPDVWGLLAIDEGHVAGHGGAMSGREIVEHHDGMAGVQKRADGMTADVTSPARDQHTSHDQRPIEL